MSRLKLGEWNDMTVTRFVDFGIYLDGGDEGDVLMPKKYVPEDVRVGDTLSCFIYLDQEERLVATMEEPIAKVGDFAWLEVAWVNEYGAFMKWGPEKDLFCPFREQKMRMEKGRSYLVHIHIDPETYRIVASAKVDRYLDRETMPPYAPGDEVSLLVQQKTDLGFKVIIDNRYGGLVYDDQVFRDIHSGDRLTGYISAVRGDGKIDVSLQQTGRRMKDEFSSRLLGILQDNGGSLPVGDKTPADDIYARFGVSKKVFKRGVGDLYKRHLIIINPEGISLTPEGMVIGGED